MGNIVCTTTMCSEGAASVSNMLRTFDDLSHNPAFNRGRYEPTVRNINQAFEDNYSFFSMLIPFNPSCCVVKEIGAQADQLTAEMLQSVGAATPGTGPGSTGPAIDTDALVTLGMLVAGAVIVGNLAPLLKAKR